MAGKKQGTQRKTPSPPPPPPPRTTPPPPRATQPQHHTNPLADANYRPERWCSPGVPHPISGLSHRRTDGQTTHVVHVPTSYTAADLPDSHGIGYRAPACEYSSIYSSVSRLFGGEISASQSPIDVRLLSISRQLAIYIYL